jgi:hypothetical protein
MCTSERCLECDGTPLRTGECIPQACTKAFPMEVWPGVMSARNAGGKAESKAGSIAPSAEMF